MKNWGKGKHVLLFLGTAGAIASLAAPDRMRALAQRAGAIPVAPGPITGRPGYPTNIPEPYVPAPPAINALIQSLGESFHGHVGIAVKSVDEGWVASYNGSERFPQQSVSKLWVAMTMLDAIDRGKLSLDTPVTIRRNDLTLFHQPIAALVTENGYTTTLSDLFFRAMTQSDNTANDSVLRTVGGPEAVRSFLARRFIDNVRFGPGERLLQSQTAGITWSPGMSGQRFMAERAALPRSARERALDAYLADPPDGAAPVGIVTALAKLKRGEMLSAASTNLLLSTMAQAKTGPQRVKGGVPAGWHYAHKTGTGQDLPPRATGYNDVGVMTAPDGSSYAIAVMIGSTTVSIPERWALMQSVSRSVAGMHVSGERVAGTPEVKIGPRP
jgi:beta-lactamase class A